jgi:RNA polymerase sigma-70 factor (ECF subfamily)
MPTLAALPALASRPLHGWRAAFDMLTGEAQRLFSSSSSPPRSSQGALAAGSGHADSGHDARQRLLVEAAAGGDRRAAEELLRALLPRVRNLVRYFVRGDAEVDDLAQESLVTVLRALGSYRGEGSVGAWTDRIVARTVFAQLKRTRASHRVHAEYGAELLPVLDGDSAPRFLARRRAIRLLDELPDEQRDVLVMHHVMGLSVREIADELDTAFETVRSRLRLGMTRLRDALGTAEGLTDADERGAP